MPESSRGPREASKIKHCLSCDGWVPEWAPGGNFECLGIETVDEYAEATNAAMNYGDGYANALEELAKSFERRLIPGVTYSREWIIGAVREFERNRG